MAIKRRIDKVNTSKPTEPEAPKRLTMIQALEQITRLYMHAFEELDTMRTQALTSVYKFRERVQVDSVSSTMRWLGLDAMEAESILEIEEMVLPYDPSTTPMEERLARHEEIFAGLERGRQRLYLSMIDLKPWHHNSTCGISNIKNEAQANAMAQWLRLLDRILLSVPRAREAIMSRIEPAELKEDASAMRSEERRVGKECRSRWSPYH